MAHRSVDLIEQQLRCPACRSNGQLFTVRTLYNKDNDDFEYLNGFVMDRVESHVVDTLRKEMVGEGRSVKGLLKLLRETVENRNQKTGLVTQLNDHLNDIRYGLSAEMRISQDEIMWIAYLEMLVDMINKAGEIIQQIKTEEPKANTGI
ncbi:hypothetical protein HDV05_004167 [Chytridiales sp. JEL 0842]|nr:hypothetical protein HDV05_004167 [Chytridiales sp. JEL 0842]